MFSKLFGRKPALPRTPAGSAGGASPPVADPGVFTELRSRALAIKPADLGLHPPASGRVVFGVVLDMAMPAGTATLVGYETGDASLYLSSGGGTIGGASHAEVREAAREWVRAAEMELDHFKPTDEFGLPSSGQANLYLLTTGGVRVATASEEAMNSGALPISSVWYAGQMALAKLIKVTS